MLRYIVGTVDYGLSYKESDGVGLVGFTYSDWAGSTSNWKSTYGCCFSLGLAAVSWFSKKKKSFALSSIESEYMASSKAICEALRLRKLMVDLFDQELRPTVIYYDNQSCIKLFENPMFYYLSKHIHIRYHFLRESKKGIYCS